MAIYIDIRKAGGHYNRKSLIRKFIHDKPETFHDQECTRTQCKPGGFRSVTELLEIVQTYYPKTSLEGLLLIINQLIAEGEPVALIWCTQVNKVVLKYVTPQQRAFVTKYSLDRYANSKGVDGYSINDYINILNNYKK